MALPVDIAECAFQKCQIHRPYSRLSIKWKRDESMCDKTSLTLSTNTPNSMKNAFEQAESKKTNNNNNIKTYEDDEMNKKKKKKCQANIVWKKKIFFWRRRCGRYCCCANRTRDRRFVLMIVVLFVFDTSNTYSVPNSLNRIHSIPLLCLLFQK